MNDTFGIGNQDGVLDLRVTGIQLQPEPDFSTGTARFQAISPIFVSKSTDASKGLSCHEFIATSEEDYHQYFIQNLLNKYNVARKHGLVEGKEVGASEINLNINNPTAAKRKLQKLMMGKKGETNIIGYQYQFQLSAPPAVLQTGYLGGWGGKNAQGFGMSKVLDTKYTSR